MDKKIMMLVVVPCLGMTACQADVDRARVHGDGYSVEVDGGYDGPHRGGNHCPPGHAKKSWC